MTEDERITKVSALDGELGTTVSELGSASENEVTEYHSVWRLNCCVAMF